MIGLVLAGLSAATTNVGFLFRHRGAAACEEVDPRHLLRSTKKLFRQKWWTLGFALAIVAYLCHAGALSMVSLSIIQAVFAAGIVFMAVLAERWFGLELGRKQWLGVGLAALGLAGLAVTGEVKAGQATTNYAPAAMVGFAVAGTVVGTVALVIGWRREHGILLAVATALLLTVTHVAFKAASGKADAGIVHVLARPYPYIVVTGGLVAFFASARSLQIGPAIPVIAVTAITGNAAAIVGGIVVFGDPLGSGTTAAVRVLAFALVVGASLLIPGPVRAPSREEQARSRPAPRYQPQPARRAA
ncbi:MAG TPA: SMR family transporter [Solirubrobacteraceae bacterium]|nr:SMR family transporter [Solirubrobacteraceae bacterium]